MPSDYLSLFQSVRERIHAPCAIALGSPRVAVELSQKLNTRDTTCFQFDRFQAQRLEGELANLQVAAKVVVAPDLWDIEPHASVIIPSVPRGDRELKLDLVEQAYHALRPHGLLAVLSPIEKDQLFPTAIKKVFGRVALETDSHGTVLWSSRDGERKRRRHEVTFPAKVSEGDYRDFIARPGLFAYGRLDEGTRALLDVVETRPGDHILEIGCGCGVAGIVAALRAGADSQLTLTDSNTRAVAVAKENASRQGLANVRCEVAIDGEGLPQKHFDLILANPPYFAQQSITRRFAEHAMRLLKRKGRFYVVTRQLEPVLEIIEEFFGEPVVLERRGYGVVIATSNR